MTVWIFIFGVSLLWAAATWNWPRVASSARIFLSVFVLLLTPPVMARVLAYLEASPSPENQCRSAQPDAYLLFMGGVYPDFMHTAQWSSLMPASLARLEHALNQWQTHPEQTLYIAASPDEASAVQHLLTALNLPGTENLVLVKGVTNTYTSARSLAREHPESQSRMLGVITSAFHMRRAADTVKKAGFQFCTMPTHYLSTTQVPAPWVIPTRSTIAQMDLMLHEIVGLFWYRLNGYAAW